MNATKKNEITVKAAESRQREAEKKHSTISRLVENAIASEKRAANALEVAAPGTREYRDALLERRLAADEMSELGTRLAEVNAEVQRARMALDEATAAQKAEAAVTEVKAADAELVKLEAEADAAARAFAASTAGRIVRLNELRERANALEGKPRGQSRGAGKWHVASVGDEFRTAAAALADREGKLSVLRRNDPARAVRFATGDASAWEH